MTGRNHRRGRRTPPKEPLKKFTIISLSCAILFSLGIQIIFPKWFGVSTGFIPLSGDLNAEAEHLMIEQEQELKSSIKKDSLTQEAFSFFGSKQAPPSTPPSNAKKIVTKFYQYKPGGSIIQNPTGGLIKNATTRPPEEVSSLLQSPPSFKIELNSPNPQVLILHSHTRESFEKYDLGYYNPDVPTRSPDPSLTVVEAGKAIASELNKHGINTLQDTTIFDYEYNQSYPKSRVTAQEYLKQYPSIKVILDVHRDAIQTDNGDRYKPTADINGKKAAQIMLITGTSGKGISIPNGDENLKFTSKFQGKMEEFYPGLTRPLLYDYRYYNQDLSTGSVLIEVGGHANTISEVIYSGHLIGNALSEVLKTMT